MTATSIIQTLLKDSKYTLAQFNEADIAAFEASSFTKTNKSGVVVPYVKCLVRNKEIKLTPEELVRQLYLKVLIENKVYE